MGDRVGVEQLYNSVKTEAKTVEFEFQLEECVKENHTRPKGPSGSPDELGSREDADKIQ